MKLLWDMGYESLIQWHNCFSLRDVQFWFYSKSNNRTSRFFEVFVRVENFFVIGSHRTADHRICLIAPCVPYLSYPTCTNIAFIYVALITVYHSISTDIRFGWLVFLFDCQSQEFGDIRQNCCFALNNLFKSGRNLIK